MHPLTCEPQSPKITVARGNLYIPQEIADIWLGGIECVALLPHDEGVLLIPLIQQSAGGLLLKTRNLRGDRVIHAQEFWRMQGYEEMFEERTCEVTWLKERAALLIREIFPKQENSQNVTPQN
jgi:hypothetical protein